MQFSRQKISILAAALASALSLSAPAQAVIVSNGIAQGTLGAWTVDVDGGGQTRSGTVTALRQDTNVLTSSEVIYDYYTYLKVGNTSFQLSTAGAAAGGGGVVSSGSFVGANSNTINWTANSTIAAGTSIMTNVFTFTSTASLGSLSLFQYLDEDVVGSGNDVFFTRGAVATNDLQLFTIDNAQGFGVSHGGAYSAAQGLVDASFIGWAVNNYNDMKPRLAAGTQNVSIAGVIEAGPTQSFNPFVGSVLGPVDIVSVLGWSVHPNANTATIVTTIGGVPDVRQIDNNVPEPASLALAALALGVLGAARRTKR